MLLNNQWITEKNQGENIYLETNKNESHNNPKSMKYRKGSSKRKVYGSLNSGNKKKNLR